MKTFIAKTLAVLLALCLVVGLIPSRSASASDLSQHWAEKEMQDFVDKGVVKGIDAHTFLPDKEMTRAEYVAMINRLLGLQERDDAIEKYRDVHSSDWFYEDMAIALKAGYMKGTSENTLSPKDVITREQAFVITGRLMGLSEMADTKVLDQFMDAKEISSWARGMMAALVKKGYVFGTDEHMLSPKKAITRAEGVVLLHRTEKPLKIEYNNQMALERIRTTSSSKPKKAMDTNSKVQSVKVTAEQDSIVAGESLKFTAEVKGRGLEAGDKEVTWSVKGKKGVTLRPQTVVDQDGRLTVAADEEASQVTVQAVSNKDHKVVGEKTIAIQAKKRVGFIRVTSRSNSIYPGHSATFVAAVAGDNLSKEDKRVVWQLEGGPFAEGTAIDENGELTVSANETAKQITVKAVSVADDKMSGSVKVRVREKYNNQDGEALDRLAKLIKDNKSLLQEDTNALTKAAIQEAFDAAQDAVENESYSKTDYDQAYEKLNAFVEQYKIKGPLTLFPSMENLHLKDGTYIGVGGGYYNNSERPIKVEVVVENGKVVSTKLNHFGDDDNYQRRFVKTKEKLEQSVKEKAQANEDTNTWLNKLYRAYEKVRSNLPDHLKDPGDNEAPAHVPELADNDAAMDSIGYAHADASTGATFSVSGYTRAIVDGMNQAYVAAQELDNGVTGILFKEDGKYVDKKDTVFVTVGTSFDPATLVIGLQKRDGSIEDVPFAQWEERGITTTLTEPYEATEANQTLKVTIRDTISRRDNTYTLFTREESHYVTPMQLEYKIGDDGAWQNIENLARIEETTEFSQGYIPNSLKFSQNIKMPDETWKKTVTFRFVDQNGKEMPYYFVPKKSHSHDPASGQHSAQIHFNLEKDYKFQVDKQAFQEAYTNGEKIQYETFFLRLSSDRAQVDPPETASTIEQSEPKVESEDDVQASDEVVVKSIKLLPWTNYEDDEEAVEPVESPWYYKEITYNRNLSDINEALIFQLPSRFEERKQFYNKYEVIVKYTVNGGDTLEKIVTLNHGGDLENTSFHLGSKEVQVDFRESKGTFNSISYAFVDNLSDEPEESAWMPVENLPSIEEFERNGGAMVIKVPASLDKVGKYLKFRYDITHKDEYRLADSVEKMLKNEKSMQFTPTTAGYKDFILQTFEVIDDPESVRSDTDEDSGVVQAGYSYKLRFTTMVEAESSVLVKNIKAVPMIGNDKYESYGKTQVVNSEADQVDFALAESLNDDNAFNAVTDFEVTITYTVDGGEEQTVVKKIAKDTLISEPQTFSLDDKELQVTFHRDMKSPALKTLSYTLVDNFDAEVAEDATWTPISLPDEADIKSNNNETDINLELPRTAAGKYVKFKYELNEADAFKLSDSTTAVLANAEDVQLKDTAQMRFLILKTASQTDNSDKYSYKLRFMRAEEENTEETPGGNPPDSVDDEDEVTEQPGDTHDNGDTDDENEEVTPIQVTAIEFSVEDDDMIYYADNFEDLHSMAEDDTFYLPEVFRGKEITVRVKSDDGTWSTVPTVLTKSDVFGSNSTDFVATDESGYVNRVTLEDDDFLYFSFNEKKQTLKDRFNFNSASLSLSEDPYLYILYGDTHLKSKPKN